MGAPARPGEPWGLAFETWDPPSESRLSFLACQFCGLKVKSTKLIMSRRKLNFGKAYLQPRTMVAPPQSGRTNRRRSVVLVLRPRHASTLVASPGAPSSPRHLVAVRLGPGSRWTSPVPACAASGAPSLSRPPSHRLPLGSLASWCTPGLVCRHLYAAGGTARRLLYRSLCPALSFSGASRCLPAA